MRFELEFKNIVVPVQYAWLCLYQFRECLIFLVVLGLCQSRVAGISKQLVTVVIVIIVTHQMSISKPIIMNLRISREINNIQVYFVSIFISVTVYSSASDNHKKQLLILFSMNYSTLDPLTHTTPLKSYHIAEEWPGQRSQRFAPSIRFQPKPDLIQSNFDMPDQTPSRGRSHFNQQNSFEQPFRPSIHKVPEIKHWHLRQSKIRTMEFRPIEVHPRPQRLHNNMVVHNPEQHKAQSIRTLYMSSRRVQKQYSVQDRMQRKSRINPVELRRTFYKDMNTFAKK